MSSLSTYSGGEENLSYEPSVNRETLGVRVLTASCLKRPSRCERQEPTALDVCCIDRVRGVFHNDCPAVGVSTKFLANCQPLFRLSLVPATPVIRGVFPTKYHFCILTFREPCVHICIFIITFIRNKVKSVGRGGGSSFSVRRSPKGFLRAKRVLLFRPRRGQFRHLPRWLD